jgi:hypothetical protein
MTFQLVVKWCDIWLIAVSVVLFAVLKGRAREKRYRSSRDKTPGLNSDTALYFHQYNISIKMSRQATETNKEKEKK